MSINIIQIEGYKKSVELDFIRNSFKKINKLQPSTKAILDYEYLYPSFISNTILEITNEVYLFEELNHVLFILEKLQCKHLVINFKCNINNQLLVFLFNKLNSFNIHEALILTNYCDYLYSEEFSKTVFLTDRHKSFFIFNSPFDRNLEDHFFYTKKNNAINYNKSINEFSINKVLYSESINHHTYFNRKLYIGPTGEIKNAPECEEIFGFIQNIDSVDGLDKIISTSAFQKYWFVKKDETYICKDCEFRYMCIDNRVPYEGLQNEWYHKTECNYNPYIAKWQGEEGYQTLEECGVISNEKGFSINHEKIAKINAVLWDED